MGVGAPAGEFSATPITDQTANTSIRARGASPAACRASSFQPGSGSCSLPGYVVFLGAQKSVSRIIPLDGRPPLGDGIKLWMGDSRGRWEGRTLVVDVRNQNSKGRFDMVGNFASDAVQVIERWTIVDANTIEYTALITDPQVYSRPWTLGSRVVRAAIGTRAVRATNTGRMPATKASAALSTWC